MTDQPIDKPLDADESRMPVPRDPTDATDMADGTAAAVAIHADEAIADHDPATAEALGTAAQAATPSRSRRRPSLRRLRGTGGGMAAVGVKELRGRMRGRRAFVILTIYLVLLGGFALMVELILERTYSTGFGGGNGMATASIGQGIFAALLMLETLQVAFLAPAATAGAISLEREKRTLELLVVTPISSPAIVLGKLFSALIYVWLLIAASIPLTAVVFVYGGVAPEDILKGYLVLVVTALGFGAFGLFASSLVKRTQAATAISVFGVLFASIGTIFLLVFWQAMASSDNGRGTGVIKGSPPHVIAYLNPFLAQVDVLCGTESSFGGWCSVQSSLLQSQNQNLVQPAVEPVPAGKEGPVILPAPIVDDSGAVVVGPDFAVGGAGISPEDAAAIREKMAAVGQANNGQFVNPADVVPFAHGPRRILAEERGDVARPVDRPPARRGAIRLADAAMAPPPSSAGRARGLMAVATAVRRRLRGGRGARGATKAVVPPDPRTVLTGELDPVLLGIRAGDRPAPTSAVDPAAGPPRVDRARGHRRRRARALDRRPLHTARIGTRTRARDPGPWPGRLARGRCAGTPPARRDGAGGGRRGLARGPRLECAGARCGVPRVRGTGT